MADFSLKAIFGVDATGLKTALADLDARVGKFADKWADIGLAAGAAAFAALSKGAIDLASHLSDTAQNLGINVISLQALEAQHKRNGVESEQLVKALEKVKTAVIKAAEGDVTHAAALEKLHLKASELIRLPLDKQYEAFAKAARNSTDQAEAYEAVTSILGEKVGPKLMASLMELGKQGLPKVTEEAKKAGEVMNAETIVALKNAGDAIEEFKKKITVAVGNIIVNFRTKEGLELLGLQLLKLLSQFGGGFLDAIKDAGTMLGAVLYGTFKGAITLFQNGMVEAVKGIAELINKVLPEKFAINVGNLDEFKSSGLGIADEINKAIANTSPSTFKKDFGEFWDKAISEAQKVVDAVNKTDLGPQAKKLTDAGKAIVIKPPEIPPLEPAPALVAWLDAFNGLVGTLTRVGKSYTDQSDASLAGVLANLNKQLSAAQTADRNRIVGVGGVDTSIDTNYLLGEVSSIQRELNQRAAVRSVITQFGETSARSQFGDTLVDRALRDMQTATTRTAVATETLSQQLGALNKKLNISPIG